MARQQVAARLEGDVYQGLFFWREAAALLNPRSPVRRVDLEHDDAAGADDVAVFYGEPGLLLGGRRCKADFYQVKYHIDRRDGYSCDMLCERGDGGKKSSLLQRLHNAFERVVDKYDVLRLHLASNWTWKAEDPLATVLREYDGALPEGFFSAGPKSTLGKIREAWCEHLGIGADRFAAFARTLHLGLDHFGRRGFTESVHDRLAAVGLRVPQEGQPSPYDSLVQQFITSGPNSFDRETLRKICEGNGLFDGSRARHGDLPTVGVRTFVRFAERLEDEVDEFLSLSDDFEGRHLRASAGWPAVAGRVVEYFAEPARRARMREREHAVMLECHGSVAALVGYELSRNSGCSVAPIQKPGRVLWKPAAGIAPPDAAWIDSIVVRDDNAPDVAVALSVTHDIAADVARFLDAPGGPSVCRLVSLKPADGLGPSSVRGPEHALQLADRAVAALRAARPSPASRVHLFSSAPNALLFFLGQSREALGRVTFYEYDFGFERHSSYEPSVALPHLNPR